MKRILVDLWRSFNLQIGDHQSLVSAVQMVVLNNA